jgi:carboxymethylenebutenolidase
MDSLDAEAQSLTPPTDISRRGFLATSLVVGFTLAAGPVHAQTVITTDAAASRPGK